MRNVYGANTKQSKRAWEFFFVCCVFSLLSRVYGTRHMSFHMNLSEIGLRFFLRRLGVFILSLSRKLCYLKWVCITIPKNFGLFEAMHKTNFTVGIHFMNKIMHKLFTSLSFFYKKNCISSISEASLLKIKINCFSFFFFFFKCNLSIFNYDVQSVKE